jgi:hypothetical protein
VVECRLMMRRDADGTVRTTLVAEFERMGAPFPLAIGLVRTGAVRAGAAERVERRFHKVTVSNTKGVSTSRSTKIVVARSSELSTAPAAMDSS